MRKQYINYQKNMLISLESFEWIASKADPKFMKSFFDTYRGRR